MSLSKKPYKGTRDLFPQEKRVQTYLFNKMRNTAHLFGYEEYDGPLLEEVELYKAKSGEELINQQIYSFLDRGKRNVAIRPEMTPTLARMIAQVHREYIHPIRWFSIPNLMRYEKPQRGRLREHWQFNCDIFGATDLFSQIEIIQVLIHLFKSLGANSKHFSIRINHRVFVDGLTSTLLGLEQEEAKKVFKLMDQSKKCDKETFKKLLSELNFNEKQQNIFNEYLQLQSLEQVIDFTLKNQLVDDSQRFEQLLSIIKSLNLLDYIVYDPSIVRGLDYYTGLVFEVFDENPLNKRALCGGGTYNELLKIFKERPLAGTGFGLGDVTLVDFLEGHNLLPDFQFPNVEYIIAIGTDEALDISHQIAHLLRGKNFSTFHFPSAMKLKKALQHANKKSASNIIYIGEDELKKDEFLLKDLVGRTQKNIKVKDFNSDF